MKKADLNILMLEDDPLDAELNKEQILLLDEYNCIVKLVDNKSDYLGVLDQHTPDLVLCDYNLPGYNGMEALNDLKTKNTLIPFIFVTGTMQEEIAADAIKAGAWDYVVKDRLFRLPLAIKSVLKLREEKEASLKAEEEINLLLAAVDQTSAQIIVSDRDFNIIYVNKKFTEVTGFTLDEVTGKYARTLASEFTEEDKFKEIDKILTKGETFKGEMLSRKKDGTKHWEYISITPIRNKENKIISYVTVKEDVSLRKKMEQEIIDARDKAQRSDQLKDVFLQNLSHEIRTPLNAIVGFSDLLINEDITPDKLNTYTKLIKNGSDQLLSIVTDVLTVASIQTGQEKTSIKPFDINEVLDNLYDEFSPQIKEKSIDLKLTKDAPDKSFLIRTDKTKLKQILTSLLNNALKFTHQGVIELKYEVINNEIEFSVSDTGIGIAKENQELIFERFQQATTGIHADYGGAGLGLSICKSFAQMIDGKLWVESEPGFGSTFFLSIPYTSVVSQEIKEETGTSLNVSSIKILVVEDDEINYLFLESVFDEHNVKIYHACNGLEAVEFCRKHPDIDLILMDIKMPVMDGITACKKIREFQNTIPMIAQTAYALSNDEKRLLENGFTDYISKPILKEDLFKKINNLHLNPDSAYT